MLWHHRREQGLDVLDQVLHSPRHFTAVERFPRILVGFVSEGDAKVGQYGERSNSTGTGAPCCRKGRSNSSKS